MRDETLALHAGLDADPATRAAAVPICHTAVSQFACANQGLAFFNLAAAMRGQFRIAP